MAIDIEKLKSIADRQSGYFTTRQAAAAGCTRDLLLYHMKQGHWTKWDRGVYRLGGYPDSPESDFVKWSLWVVGHQEGRLVVVSHESALYFYGLAVAAPAGVHLTVPRLKYKKEKIGCHFHYGALAVRDYARYGGYAITTPYRTLLDMRPDLVLQSRWAETVHAAKKHGLIDEAAAIQLAGSLAKSPSRFGTIWPTRPASVPNETRITGKGINDMTEPGDLLVAQGKAGKATLCPISAHNRIRPLRLGSLGGNGAFTLVELLVVICVVSILMALLLPSLIKAKNSAQTVTCQSSLRQVGITANLYAGENNECLPPAQTDTPSSYFYWRRNFLEIMDPRAKGASGATLRDVIMPAGIYYNIFWCPTMTASYGAEQHHAGRGSYSMNGYFLPNTLSHTAGKMQPNLRVSQCPGKIEPYLIDGVPMYLFTASANAPYGAKVSFTHTTFREAGMDFRHNGLANTLYVDGHCKSFNVARGEELEAQGDVVNWDNFK